MCRLRCCCSETSHSFSLLSSVESLIVFFSIINFACFSFLFFQFCFMCFGALSIGTHTFMIAIYFCCLTLPLIIMKCPLLSILSPVACNDFLWMWGPWAHQRSCSWPVMVEWTWIIKEELLDMQLVCVGVFLLSLFQIIDF